MMRSFNGVLNHLEDSTKAFWLTFPQIQDTINMNKHLEAKLTLLITPISIQTELS